MSKLFKKPIAVWIATAICALLVFAFTDLYYHFFALYSFTFIAFVVGIAACFVFLFSVAFAAREKKMKVLSILLPALYAVILLVALVIVPIRVSEPNRMYFHWAQVFSYVAFGLEMLGFIIYALLLLPPLRIKCTAVACVIILAVSVTAISCWGALDRSVADSIKTYTWELDAPEYEDGTLSRVYNCGVMKGDQYHDGKYGVNKETNFMQIAAKTSLASFNDYCKKVEASGYALECNSEIESIVSRTYSKDGKLLHVYFNKTEKTTRIITDPIGVSPKAASYDYDVKDNDVTMIYQYALMYDDDCDADYDYGGGIERCGMNYVIRLADNKLIVIDGGDICQASDSAVKGFYDLCKEITGSEDLTIACWLCTHAHGDHISFFSKFLRVYNEHVTLERYMYNFANWKEVAGGNEDAWYALFRRFELYAPNALQIKPHTGEVFTFANAKIEILYTHEDAFNYHTNKTDISDFNDTSVTYRFTFNDKTHFLVLGDMSRCAQYIVNQNYTAETLKTEIVQAAHHGYNGLDILYPIMDPDYVFFPQGYDNAVLHENKGAGYNYDVLLRFADKDNIFLVNRYTYGLFIDKNGNISKDPKNETEARKYVGPKFWEGEYFDGTAN